MTKFLDIDEILADDERLTCRMMQETADLGHLNSNINSVDLPRDAKVEIPMWLAQVFFEVSSHTYSDIFFLYVNLFVTIICIISSH